MAQQSLFDWKKYFMVVGGFTLAAVGAEMKLHAPWVDVIGSGLATFGTASASFCLHPFKTPEVANEQQSESQTTIRSTGPDNRTEITIQQDPGRLQGPIQSLPRDTEQPLPQPSDHGAGIEPR